QLRRQRQMCIRDRSNPVFPNFLYSIFFTPFFYFISLLVKAHFKASFFSYHTKIFQTLRKNGVDFSFTKSAPFLLYFN
ncbi:hypothetical protein KQJ29_29500, partial [Enterococcus sp. S181_ASV_20]|nr:hypothetical protein [Enterococcus sp. S181_ASV_20]